MVAVVMSRQLARNYPTSRPLRASERRYGYWLSIVTVILLVASAVLAGLIGVIVQPALEEVAQRDLVGRRETTPDSAAEPVSGWETQRHGPFHFPRDEGAHRGVGVEWWYLNGRLTGERGTVYHFMVSFFKYGAAAASILNTKTGDHTYYSFHRVDHHAASDHLELDYSEAQLAQAGLSLFRYRLVFNAPSFALNLILTTEGAPLIVDGDGAIRMGLGESSYYSLTDLDVSGNLTPDGDGRTVAVNGSAWMDHQWGNFAFPTDWDWFAITLECDWQIMVFNLYGDSPRYPIWKYVSVVRADGSTIHLRYDETVPPFYLEFNDYWRSPATGVLYSSGWSLYIPQLDLHLDLDPLVVDQEVAYRTRIKHISPLKPFWEGACHVSGRIGEGSVAGYAFVETIHDYGCVAGDIELTGGAYMNVGSERVKLWLSIENTDGYMLGDWVLGLFDGDPYNGSRCIERYAISTRDNATAIYDTIKTSLAGPLYILIDIDNTLAESDELNNHATVLGTNRER